MQKKSWVREWVETIIVALVLALIIRTFVVQVFFIPTGSMEPTLEVDDRIIVSKFFYKLKGPERFDIAVFRYPHNKPDEPKRDLIKRIIGLPGETIEARKGIVFINGKELSEEHTMRRDISDFGPVKIPGDAYFMMGDNRMNSSDSRVWGYLPKKYLIGPAFIRIWPLSRLGFLSDK